VRRNEQLATEKREVVHLLLGLLDDDTA